MGRPVSLTEEISKGLEYYWQLAGDTMSDEQICDRLGIRFAQLRGWLQRNRKPKLKDGSKSQDGLRDVRVRAKAATLTGYLVRLNRLAQAAENNQDYRTAGTITMWLTERQFPTVYGNRQKIDVGLEGQGGVLVVPGVIKEGEWELYYGDARAPQAAQEQAKG